jgi:hypothetical protein
MSTRTAIAAALAERTADAYSADRFASWQGLAEDLLAAGYSEREAEAIMRSKYARWSADDHGAEYGQVPASALVDYAKKYIRARELAALVAETFGDESAELSEAIAKYNAVAAAFRAYKVGDAELAEAEAELRRAPGGAEALQRHAAATEAR